MAIQNLVTFAGMECEDDGSLIGVGMYFFIGVFISFMLWIKCTDRWARKPIIIMGSAFQIAAFTGTLFYPHTLKFLGLYYFLLGLGTVLSACTSYNYLIEFTPRHSKIAIATLFLSM